MTKKTDNQQEKKSLIAPNTVIKLIIPKAEVEQAYKKALKKLAKKIKVDGFRKGNVPTKIAEENIKAEQIIEEALQLTVPEIYTKEIKRLEKQPLTYPEFNPVSLEKGKDWVVEAFIAERPKITLNKYQEIVKKAQKEAVKEIEKQAKEHIETVHKNEKDGAESTHKHEEPTEAEKNNFTLQFIYQELIKELKPEIQELLVKEEVRYDLDNLAHRLKDMNIPFEKFLEHRKMTFEQLSTELAVGALSRLQASFIINEIAVEQKISVTAKDLDAEFDKIKDEKLRIQQKTDHRYVDMMSQTILREKVADHLLSIK